MESPAPERKVYNSLEDFENGVAAGKINNPFRTLVNLELCKEIKFADLTAEEVVKNYDEAGRRHCRIVCGNALWNLRSADTVSSGYFRPVAYQDSTQVSEPIILSMLEGITPLVADAIVSFFLYGSYAYPHASNIMPHAVNIGMDLCEEDKTYLQSKPAFASAVYLAAHAIQDTSLEKHSIKSLRRVLKHPSCGTGWYILMQKVYAGQYPPDILQRLRSFVISTAISHYETWC